MKIVKNENKIMKIQFTFMKERKIWNVEIYRLCEMECNIYRSDLYILINIK